MVDTEKRTVKRPHVDRWCSIPVHVEIDVPIFKSLGCQKALPLVGDTFLLKKAVGVVSTNWEGNVDHIFPNTTPREMRDEWFEPNDKGIFSLYGVDQSGSIIFGMSKYQSDERSSNPLEQEPHYYIEQKNCTQSY